MQTNATLKTSYISIHALREEGDPIDESSFTKSFEISIHALREEGDRRLLSKHTRHTKFLSTPSARRATACAVAIMR